MFASVRFEVVAGIHNEFLNYLMDSNFVITSINSNQLGFNAVCDARDYKAIAKQAKKFQCKTKIIEKIGLYFSVRNYLKRKGLLVGIIVFMFFSWYFNNIVWKIDIQTNNNEIKNSIASIIYNNDIYVGGFVNQEKIEKTKNDIFFINEDIGYITLNFKNGIITCDVDEHSEKYDYLKELKMDNITSSLDGIITDIRVYSGFTTLKVGDVVGKGDMLVSKSSEIIKPEEDNYLAQGWIPPIQFQNPRAYIEAQAEKTYSTVIPTDKNIELFNGEYKKELSVKMLNKEFDIIKLNKKPNSLISQNISSVQFFGFNIPITYKSTRYYEIEEINIKANDNIDNLAKIQIDTIISDDENLKKIDNKEYEIIKDDDKIRINCKVFGIYQICQ